jgi:integrase
MKSKKLSSKQEMKKPDFGSIYTTAGSKYLYLSCYYFKQRLRFPTDRVDTEENREELRQFMNSVGEKIKRGTFQFAKAFYWLDQETKNYYSGLEGREVHPEPEHVTFGEYAERWIEKKVPTFASVTKQRDYLETLNSRILPHFGAMPFASITATAIDAFLESIKRASRSKDPNRTNSTKAKTPLSVKRIKNIIGPMPKIWLAACNDFNWNLRDPFLGITEKYKELTDRALQEQERQQVLLGDEEPQEDSRREVFLCQEWQRLLSFVEPHYHLAMDLMLMGMIGSELEGLQKQHVSGGFIQVRCAVVRDKEGKVYLKFKPKNWFRKRQLPMTLRLRGLVDKAVAASQSSATIEFANDIALPASQFVLSMKDGSPFNYDSFVKTVWNKAMKAAGIPARVPYASRHTFVQWALLLGVAKTRLVDLMGHSTKKMIDEVYGSYRQGLVEEREAILDYLGEDFLALEELKTTFPERYRSRMAVETPEKPKAPVLAATFGQSFGQSPGLYADNYLM